ncbi:hypothetical protein ACFL3Q_11235 [Planctomycetota bacterium]
MKPVEKIEKLIKERRYKASAETYDKALGSFLQAVDKHIGQKSAPTEPKIWRRIVNSRITKLAAAAVIIIAAYVVIHQSGGSIDITTVTFAQMTENMKNMPCLHAVIEGERAEGTKMIRDRMEGWFCFERKTTISKQSSGEVLFQDDLKQSLQIYDPANDTITVSGVTPLEWNRIGGSAVGFPKAVMKLFEDAGEKVTRETGKYKGKDALIFKMSAFLGGMDMKVEMTVDAKMQVVVFINQQAFDKDGKLTVDANAHFDYPETGPESIYDVGVPRSAKTVRDEKEEEKTTYEKAFGDAIAAVDARESWPEPRDLVVAYWQARNAKNYAEMAILWPSSAVWNQSLEKEEPVEYVFGEVQTGELDGYIVVPYATRGYYDKHGKYSLKMVLNDKKSAKKRYYIVSGN